MKDEDEALKLIENLKHNKDGYQFAKLKYTISKNYNLSPNFIREHMEFLNIKVIAKYRTLTEDFINELSDLFHPYGYEICEHQVLSEDFIRQNIISIRWDQISRYQALSEGFMREFQDKLDWERVSYAQNLSGGFMRDFQDEVSWDLVSKYQTLSKLTIEEFWEMLDLNIIKSRNIMDNDFLEPLIIMKKLTE